MFLPVETGIEEEVFVTSGLEIATEREIAPPDEKVLIRVSYQGEKFRT